jgi:hypothetical protein
MKIASLASFCFLIYPPVSYATQYEVLVVDIANKGNREKAAEFEKAVAKFNALQHKGYHTAKPYFNVLQMSNGQIYFVFGFKGEVQGIHRENYPNTVKNLRKLENDGVRKYPNMQWLPVEEIRKLLVAP